MENRTFTDWLNILPQIKSNTIPPMTHPYGRVWEQPALSEIDIDDKYAVMNRESFLKIKNYSRSQPSGVYEGKMWRSSDDEKTWYLHWWGFSDDPDKCSGNVREIKITDEN
jgi:hypothetical protein